MAYTRPQHTRTFISLHQLKYKAGVRVKKETAVFLVRNNGTVEELRKGDHMLVTAKPYDLENIRGRRS